MNRIQQLILEAGSDVSGKWLGLNHAENLAKSIVQECVDMIIDEAYRYEDQAWAVILVNDIKDHFGVE